MVFVDLVVWTVYFLVCRVWFGCLLIAVVAGLVFGFWCYGWFGFVLVVCLAFAAF